MWELGGKNPSEPAFGQKPLQRDIRLLRMSLSKVIRQHGSEALFDRLNQLEAICLEHRRDPLHHDLNADDTAEKVHALLAEMSPQMLSDVIRSLLNFFDLANIAEDRHRIRVLRERERQLYPMGHGQSVYAAIRHLHAQGFDAEAMQHLIDQLSIELVFTAHPTEAKRRTVRATLRRIRDDLAELDSSDMLPGERKELLQRVRNDVACLWETDSIRPRRPSVLEEVRRGLYLADSLWTVVPRIYRQMRQSLQAVYPGYEFRFGPFLTFGSWIGGDRDGHPYVTTRITRQTLELLRKTAIDRHLQMCHKLRRRLSYSVQRHKVSDELLDAVQRSRNLWPTAAAMIDSLNPHEIYRQWLIVIEYRLRQTLAGSLGRPLPEAAYAEVEQLRRDVRIIEKSLIRSGHGSMAEEMIHDWLAAIDVFGLHFASLDIREDGPKLNSIVDQLMKATGTTQHYADMAEHEKQHLLLQRITPEAVDALRQGELEPDADEVVRLFMLIHETVHQFGRRALGTLIVSMTHQPSDVLSLIWLSRLAGAASRGVDEQDTALPVVPLFETIDDLEKAADMLESLLGIAAYRDYLGASGGKQICMIGYSDSAKDGGYLAANWALYQAQRRLGDVALAHDVPLMLFHGRGGALGRGGGPTARGILSLPPQSVRGQLRMTEQGEVLAERYDHPHIAHRHLEQVIWATLLISAEQPHPDYEQWAKRMDQAARGALEHYRALSHQEGFVQYFRQATPIEGIEQMPIGSRPASRGGDQSASQPASLQRLRAISFTFSWIQSRQLINAYYGLGQGFAAMMQDEDSREQLKQMYDQWLFFRGMMDNAELALAKCDMWVARQYAVLTDPVEVGMNIHAMIRDEYERSQQILQAITHREALLSNTHWLAESIRLRNPRLDILNLIQVHVLKTVRTMRAKSANPREIEAYEDVLRLSIQAIAAGMRTTG